jgi:membrane-associated phospholipid phosphatase
MDSARQDKRGDPLRTQAAAYGVLALVSLGLPFILRPIDVWVYHRLLPLKSLPWDAFLEILVYGGHGVVLGGLLIGLFLWGKRRGTRALVWAGQFGFVALLSGGLVVQILKHLFGRARPWAADAGKLIGPTLAGGFNSFPSGHSISAFAVGAVLGHAFPSCRTLFFVLAAVVALSRVLVGAHFLSDVIAGSFLGLTVGTLVALRFPLSTADPS